LNLAVREAERDAAETERTTEETITIRREAGAVTIEEEMRTREARAPCDVREAETTRERTNGAKALL